MPGLLHQLRTRALPQGPLDLARQIVLFVAALYGYGLVRGMVDDPTGAAVAFQNARRLISVENALHVFVEPSVQAWAQSKPIVIDLASWLYINAQTSVTLGALVFLYLFHNQSFYFVRNMFMVAMAIALIGYLGFPTAPPRFFPEWGFFDAVSDLVGVQSTDNVSALFNPYAAVPSMHVCFALLISVPLARLCAHRAARVFWAAYPLLVLFVIVATANHFLADAALGALTAAGAAYAATWLARTRPAAWAFAPARSRPFRALPRGG